MRVHVISNTELSLIGVRGGSGSINTNESVLSLFWRPSREGGAGAASARELSPRSPAISLSRMTEAAARAGADIDVDSAVDDESDVAAAATLISESGGGNGTVGLTDCAAFVFSALLLLLLLLELPPLADGDEDGNAEEDDDDPERDNARVAESRAAALACGTSIDCRRSVSTGRSGNGSLSVSSRS